MTTKFRKSILVGTEVEKRLLEEISLKQTWWTRRKFQLKKHSKAFKQSTTYVKIWTWEGPLCLLGDKRRPLWLQKNKWLGLVQYDPGENGRNWIIHRLINHNIFGFYPQSTEFNTRKWHDKGPFSKDQLNYWYRKKGLDSSKDDNKSSNTF